MSFIKCGPVATTIQARATPSSFMQAEYLPIPKVLSSACNSYHPRPRLLGVPSLFGLPIRGCSTGGHPCSSASTWGKQPRPLHCAAPRHTRCMSDDALVAAGASRRPRNAVRAWLRSPAQACFPARHACAERIKL